MSAHAVGHHPQAKLRARDKAVFIVVTRWTWIGHRGVVSHAQRRLLLAAAALPHGMTL